MIHPLRNRVGIKTNGVLYPFTMYLSFIGLGLILIFNFLDSIDAETFEFGGQNNLGFAYEFKVIWFFKKKILINFNLEFYSKRDN